MDVHGGRRRTTWANLPDAVRATVERLAGARVEHAESALGGFSPGFASTLTLADGRRVFAKAAGARTAPGSADLLRREHGNLVRLGPLDLVPRLLAAEDDGDWVVVVSEHVAGTAPSPSEPGERAMMIGAFERAAAAFTPAPIEAEPFAHAAAGALDAWEDAPDDRGAEVDPWVAENLALVRKLAASWREASVGATLVHGDLRADNMVLSADAVWIVDWTEVCVGASWLDWVMAVPSVCLFPGTPEPEDLFRESVLWREAPPSAATSVLAALTGYFLCSSVLPSVPALQPVRDFQRAQGHVAAGWLRERVGRGLV